MPVHHVAPALGLPYESFVPLSPPRAEDAISPDLIPLFEQKGWWGQFKKNGTYSVVYVSPGGREVLFRDRHKKPHATSFWTPSVSEEEFWRAHSGSGWRVFCAELRHKKGSEGVRDTFFIHDVVVMDGSYLVDSEYQSRYQILLDVFEPGDDFTTSHWRLDDKHHLARNIRTDLRKVFDQMLNPKDDEGLVLKDPRGRLPIRKGRAWTVKCRHPHTNYGF
jgi:hypothetical protein